MSNDEAKFILAAYRPNGEDATDPLFAEPLAQASHDPDLKAWFDSQLAFDTAVSAKLRAMQPPPGLRETILAGASVSRRRDPPYRRWPWFAAAAAAIMVALVLAAVLRRAPGHPELDEFARFALRDTALDGAGHFGSVAAMREIEERLAETRFHSGRDLNFDLARLRGDGCRTVRVAGREVFEICFGRDHEFHLYLARRDDLADADTAAPKFTSEGQLSAATWADSRFAYSLVTSAGMTALRQRF